MTYFKIFVYFLVSCLQDYGTEAAASGLIVKAEEESVRSKHMVSYHRTVRGEYPYSLSLQALKNNKFVHICGATLLNVQDTLLAVTSASCLEENDPYGNLSLSLVAGVVQYNRTEYQQRRGVCKIVVHEDYVNMSMDPVHPRKNDVALLFINLKLPFEINFKINVFPIELPTSREQVIEEPVIAVGWEVGENGTFLSHVFETPVLTRKQCVDDFYLQARAPCLMAFHLSHICAANEEPFEGGKQSRGSPILSNTVRYLAAIWSESYSKGSPICGPHPTPAIYTSMPYYRDWINQQVEIYKKQFKMDDNNPKFLCD